MKGKGVLAAMMAFSEVMSISSGISFNEYGRSRGASYGKSKLTNKQMKSRAKSKRARIARRKNR